MWSKFDHKIRCHIVDWLRGEYTLYGIGQDKICETFDEWMMALLPHYKEAHAEIMSNPHKTEEDKTKWMNDNKTRFNEL